MRLVGLIPHDRPHKSLLPSSSLAVWRLRGAFGHPLRVRPGAEEMHSELRGSLVPDFRAAGKDTAEKRKRLIAVVISVLKLELKTESANYSMTQTMNTKRFLGY